MTYSEWVELLKRKLRVDASFDLMCRGVNVAHRPGTLFFVDGLSKDEVLDKMLQFLAKIPPEDLSGVTDAQGFIDRFITYVEVEHTADTERVVTSVLSGAAALVVEAYSPASFTNSGEKPVSATARSMIS